MGAIITRREYTNEFRPEVTSWLLGNVGDKISLELDVEISISVDSTLSNPFDSNGSNQIIRSTGSFLEDGFFIGSTVYWLGTNSGTVFNGVGVVTTLTPNTMRVNLTSGTFAPAGDYPFNNGTTENLTLNIYALDNVQGVELNYNLIANSEIGSASLNSLVDGSTPRFEAVGIDPTDFITPVQLVPVGFNSGHSVFSSSILGQGKTGSVQKFKITIVFQIIPLFDVLSDFQNNVAPSFLFDNDSLTDVFKLKFLPQLNNPNISIFTDSTTTALSGNVGWFDENFNGNASIYSTVGVSYTSTTGTNVLGVSKDENTNFQISINQTGATASSKYKIGFIAVPFDKTLISDNSKKNYENLLLNDLNQVVDQSTGQFTFGGYANANGAKMGVRFDSVTNSGTDVLITGQFQPNNDFITYFDSINKSNWNYILFVSVANESLASNVSDRTTLLCDFNQLQEVPPAFVLGDLTTELLNHAQGIGNIGEPFYLGTVEDEVLTKTLFYLDTAKTESIDTIKLKVEGFNTVNGQTFDCENYEIDTSIFPVDTNGIQLFNVDTTRGFQMKPGVDKNFVKIVREQTEDIGTKKAFWIYFAIRPRWEYWIENSNVSNDLVDGTKQFDGKNQNWARLDSVFNNWKLRFSVETKLNSNSLVVNTKNSKNIYIRTFDESNVWDGSITHYDETKTVNLFTGLNSDNVRTNAILDDNKTLIEADFDLEDIAGDVGTIGDYYGVIRIETFENGGIKGIEMISTVLENTNGILKPVTGSTKCKIEKISATKIRLSALIDNNLLNTSFVNYKTSARIGFKNLVTAGIYGQQYGSQYS